MTVTLREITWDTLHDILRLKVKPGGQIGIVVPGLSEERGVNFALG